MNSFVSSGKQQTTNDHLKVEKGNSISFEDVIDYLLTQNLQNTTSKKSVSRKILDYDDGWSTLASNALLITM